MGLLKKGKTHSTAPMTDLVTFSHSREGKTLSYGIAGIVANRAGPDQSTPKTLLSIYFIRGDIFCLRLTVQNPSLARLLLFVNLGLRL